MHLELRPLTAADAEAHNAGEDEETVRWLTGDYGTIETTVRHFATLAENEGAGRGKRGFGVWMDQQLAGYIDCDPDLTDGLDAEDVNISYAVHPWARGRGVATEAVRLMCDFVKDRQLGARAAIRVEPGNASSVRVAEKSGFAFVREFTSGTDTHPDGTPAVMLLYRRTL